MTTLQIELSESTVESLRQKAQLSGKTTEAVAAEILTQCIPAVQDKSWIKEFLDAARTSSGNATGWKWNREELYDR